MQFKSEGTLGVSPSFSLALLRMGFGILYVHAAWQKAPWVIQDGQPFGWLYGWIWKEINHPTFDWYKAFLQNAFLPNFTFFGYMSFFTEIALGVSLLFGLFTVLGGIGGALWQFNIALGSFSVPGEWVWIWFLLIAPHLVFAQSRAGRCLGIDRLLSDRIAGSPAQRTGIAGLLLRFV